MVNKKILAGAGVVIVGALVGGYLFLSGKGPASLVSPASKSPAKVTEKAKPLELTIWKDPLGFTFSYPKDAKLNPHDEDQENYAHVELTSSEHPGGIIVWAKDTTYATVEDWVNEDPVAMEASALGTNLSEEEAKKLFIVQPEKRLVTGAIYDNLLFLIEVTPRNESYWERAYDEVLKSFSFGTVAGSGDSVPGGQESAGGEEESGGIDEGEEVVE